MQAVLTSAVESGISTFLFPAEHQHLADEWKGIVNFNALLCEGDTITDMTDRYLVNAVCILLRQNWMLLTQTCSLQHVGRMRRVSSAREMQAAAKDCDQPGFLVMDCSDWQIIPAENLVAAFQVCHHSAAMP